MDQERRNWTMWRRLKIEVEGRSVVGSYSHNRWYKLVEVKTVKGSKITKLVVPGGSSPQVLARLLLRELAKEGKA
jgi:hypothetical protein